MWLHHFVYFYGVVKLKLNTLYDTLLKVFLISSTRPRDFDGMLGTGLLVSMYTTKTPIDMWRF
jgi:hypothetical protein